MSTYRETCRARRELIAHEIRTTSATFEEIGVAYGISRSRVHQIAKLYGIERRPRQKPPAPETE